VWHGLPYGIHALGLLHYVDPAGDKQANQVDTSGELCYWPQKHWPALAFSTVYAVCYDAFNVWFENGAITRHDFSRVQWQWYPSHLLISWEAGPIRITFNAAMADGNTGRIRVQVQNTGEEAREGTLVVKGDDNWCNCNARGQSWAKQDTHFTWQPDGQVVVDKALHWGLCHEFFPYFANLKAEDQQFEWTTMYYRMQFAVEGDIWSRTDERNTWRLQQQLSFEPGQVIQFNIDLAGTWFGTNRPGGDAATTPIASEQSNNAAVNNRQVWTDWYERIPVPQTKWPEPIQRLYYKAWTSVLYNTIPPGDLVFFKSNLPIGVCCKLATSAMTCCPATWESALIALCMSLVDGHKACELIEAIFAPISEDGYLGELPGSIRSSQLPVVEPFVVWCCYRASQDRAFLERIYKSLRANLLYKTRHPTWYHHGPFMVRNYAYANIGGKYVLRIARELGRPDNEIDELNQLIDHTRRAVNSYWDDRMQCYHSNFAPALGKGFSNGAHESGTDAEALVPLCMEDNQQRRTRLIEIIRDEFLTDNGVIQRKPKTLPRAMSGTWDGADNHADFTLKESNLMFLLKAVKDEDRALFDRIAKGTLKNIRIDGDFYECYSFDGHGQHNGPGSIFGAFAVIWSVLLYEDQIDGLYA